MIVFICFEQKNPWKVVLPIKGNPKKTKQELDVGYLDNLHSRLVLQHHWRITVGSATLTFTHNKCNNRHLLGAKHDLA